MTLLERDGPMLALTECAHEATAGHGRLVLISGEAGIGKTSLVDRFASEQPRVLWGACEALFTPRPLGPLHDIAHLLSENVRQLLASGANRSDLFVAVLAALATGRAPAMLVFEDVHWADEATLDLVKFLGRRLRHLPVLFILTYRDDEVPAQHPLRTVLGDMPSGAVTRLRLESLSPDAVALLARAAGQKTSELLYATTGGNPFYVTEALASPGDAVPASVRDAVLTRASRLSTSARGVLNVAAVVPTRAEQWLIEAVCPSADADVEECLDCGMLHLEGGSLSFRHELARLAIESAMPPPQRTRIHGDVLRALLARQSDVDMSRIVHHATLAGDGMTVLRCAPEAARQAAAHSAHREAASHYATALRFADALPFGERADLLEKHSYECYLTGQFSEALAARQSALTIWRSANEAESVGRCLRWLSRLSWFLGQRAEADTYGEESVRLLEPLGPSRERAMALSNMAQLGMLREDLASARRWGQQAISLAEELNDVEILSHALNNVGTAELLAGDESGGAHLTRSLKIALSHGLEEHAARAYINLTSISVQRHDHERVARYIDEASTYCTEHDLDAWGLYLLGVRAMSHFRRGDWSRAAEDAYTITRIPSSSKPSRLQAWTVNAWMRVRRGDPGAASLLDETLEVALKTQEVQRIGPVYVARAELAWLRGDLARCREEALLGYEAARECANEWIRGELASWLWRGGGLDEPPAEIIAMPYVLSLTGDWQGAAAVWERLGSPYEQALALADGDTDAQIESLAIFERLGAKPALDLVRARLRSAGARGIPRGPRPSTRENPAGLTNQQLKVLQLVAEGLTNAEIAERLCASPKTVGHHVSALLMKLDSRSRTQLVAAAHQRGIIA